MNSINSFNIFFQILQEHSAHGIHNLNFHTRTTGFEFAQHIDMMNIAYHSSIMHPNNPIGYIPMTDKPTMFAYRPDGVFFHLIQESDKAYYLQLKSVISPINPLKAMAWEDNYIGMCDTLSIGFLNHSDFINHDMSSVPSWFQKVDYSHLNDDNIKVTSDLKSHINTLMDRQVHIQEDYYLKWGSFKNDFTRYE